MIVITTIIIIVVMMIVYSLLVAIWVFNPDFFNIRVSEAEVEDLFYPVLIGVTGLLALMKIVRYNESKAPSTLFIGLSALFLVVSLLSGIRLKEWGGYLYLERRTITMIFLHVAPLSSYMLVRLSSKNKLAIMALVNLLGITSTYLTTLYWIIGLSRVVT